VTDTTDIRMEPSRTKALTARLARRNRRAGPRRSQTVGALWAAPALIMVLVFFVVPVVYMVYMSFQNWPLLGEHSFVGLRNYTDAIHDPRFLEPVRFTILYTVLIVPALLVAGLGMASLVRAKRRGSGLFRTLFFLPVVVGFAAAGYLWLWFVNPRVGPLPQILRSLGFGSLQDPWLGTSMGALLVVCLMVLWKFSGFTMLLFMTGMQTIPDDIMEAARVDGAGRWRLLRSITLPLLRRTIALVVILTTAGSLLAFDQFFVMTRGGPNNHTITVVYAIYRQSFSSFRLGYGAALSVMLAAVLLVISAIQLRLLRSDDD
jgi:multiple sugar transport system permease protein